MQRTVLNNRIEFGLFFIGIVLFFGCKSNNKEKTLPVKSEKKNLEIVAINDTAGFNSYMAEFGLYDLSKLDKRIFFEIKYASSDNFMHQVLYSIINKPFLQKDVADRLMKCQDALLEEDSSFHLFIYDAVRPLDVQWKMWHALDSLKPSERVKFVSNPVNKSLHNYGAAIDLTICDSKGNPLDMGAGFDDIRKIAYPSMEAHFLATGELTEQQIANRSLLRKVMRSQGFRNLPTEWWHFNACSRKEASQKYRLLEKEFTRQ